MKSESGGLGGNKVLEVGDHDGGGNSVGDGLDGDGGHLGGGDSKVHSADPQV